MKKSAILSVSVTCMLLFLNACDSSSGAATNSSTTNAGNAKGTCQVAAGVPGWTGANSITWQEALGNSCIASSVNASVAEMSSYSTVLSDSGWTSSAGWVTSGTVSAALYEKNKNIDTAYELSMAGSSTNSQYTFTLTQKVITYASPIQRIFYNLPKWTVPPAPQWELSQGKYSVEYFFTDTANMSAYKSALKSNGWSGNYSSDSTVEKFTMMSKGDEYILTIGSITRSGNDVSDSEGAYYLELKKF